MCKYLHISDKLLIFASEIINKTIHLKVVARL